MRTFVVLLAAVTALAEAPRPTPQRQSPLPPARIGILEGPDRDEWQQPDRVMDELLIAEGDRVADLGAGGGWFTIRLAHRVGPNGVVFAQDIQPAMLESIRRRVGREGLTNVQMVLGTPDDPSLEDNLRAVLIVDIYPQLVDPVTVLRRAARSLAPNGRIGIVDFKTDGEGGPGPDLRHRVRPDAIKLDAFEAGLTLVKEESFLRYQYFLIFSRQGVR
jgi:ubiquinone/menaquinone biosynthesis C-methylase UbiE